MDNQVKVIAVNRKASYDYFLFDKYEAGLVLKGCEIKSIREGKVNLKDSYVLIRNSEAFILNMHIASYDKATIFIPQTNRTRKLLLNKIEINKIFNKVNEKGFTIVPTRIYLKNGLAKLEIALAKGKKNYDKRETEKSRDVNRNIHKMIKEINS